MPVQLAINWIGLLAIVLIVVIVVLIAYLIIRILIRAAGGLLPSSLHPSDWADSFGKPLSGEEILERVRKLQLQYRTWFWVTVAIILVGAFQALVGPISVRTALALGRNHQPFPYLGFVWYGSQWGPFLMLVGIIGNCTVKLSAQIRLSTLYMMWESRQRQETELRRSIAQDL